jgi:hypothetical protein
MSQKHALIHRICDEQFEPAHVFQKQNFSAKEGAARAKKVRRRFLDGTSHSSVGWNKKNLF